MSNTITFLAFVSSLLMTQTIAFYGYSESNQDNTLYAKYGYYYDYSYGYTTQKSPCAYFAYNKINYYNVVPPVYSGRKLLTYYTHDNVPHYNENIDDTDNYDNEDNITDTDETRNDVVNDNEDETNNENDVTDTNGDNNNDDKIFAPPPPLSPPPISNTAINMRFIINYLSMFCIVLSMIIM